MVDDSDNDGICDDVDQCPYDYDNDIDGDGLCVDDDPSTIMAFVVILLGRLSSKFRES